MPDDLVDARFLQDNIARDSLEVGVVHLIAECLFIIDLFPDPSLRQLKRADSFNRKTNIVLKSGELIVKD